MRTVYICSPYRAESEEILKRNIEYAKELTREALLRGDAPITVHLYMTQCLTEEIEEERNIGLAAGREIIEKCDAMLVGYRYGVSEGMDAEIARAKEKGIYIQYTN